MTALDINKAFFELVLYRYSGNSRIFFQVMGHFLLLMSGFQTMKPRHVDKCCKQDETAIILTKYSCKRNFAKIRNFLHSFASKISLLNQSSLSFLMWVRTNLKSFSCSTCDKNWKHSVKLCYQQISNLLQPVRVMFFSLQLQFR